MDRPFHLLEEVGHAVEVQARSARAEVTGLHLERRDAAGGGSAREAAAQRFIDDLLERPAASPRKRLQLHRDIVVKRDGGAHG